MCGRGISDHRSRMKDKINGFALLLTLILMATMSAIVGALIISLTTYYRGTSAQASGFKAVWISEAGLADAVKRLKNSEITLSDGQSSAIPSTSFGGGSYSVSLSRTGNYITLISTGTFNGRSRIVEQIETLGGLFPTAFNYAVFGSNSNTATLSIGNTNSATVVISGDLFYGNGISNPSETVQVRNNSQVINGLIYADSVTGGGTFTKATSNPNPVPTYPSFSTTYYDNQITIADSAPRSSLTLSGSSNLNLAGQTLYYNTVTIKNTATVTGPGTIVARQAVTIQDSAAIGQNVNFIGKASITFQNSATVQQGGSFYGRGNIVLNTNTNVNSSLLTPGSGVIVRVQDDATFKGIIYADVVDLNNNAIVNGSVVANRFSSNVISNNVHLTFNSSYLPSSVPTGFTSQLSYTQKANSWQECPVPVGPPC